MLSFLRLIRLPNLLIIAATQYLMRYCIIYPMININEFQLQLSQLDFFLLVLSTMLIAAAGYIINDYFDTKIDAINKPERLIVGHTISRRVAMALHLVFNIIAILLGFYIGAKAGVFKIGFIYLMAAGALWYYSTTFKKSFITGNILIALLSALVPLLVGIVEIPLLNQKYLDILVNFQINFNNIFFFILAYSGFAFLMTLGREIIKDVEDMEGDVLFGSMTLPIAIGIKKTKVILYLIFTLIMVLLAKIQTIQFVANDKLSFFYFLLALQLPILFLLYKIYKANDKKDFHFLSLVTKGIMLLGICYTFIIYYSFKSI